MKLRYDSTQRRAIHARPLSLSSSADLGKLLINSVLVDVESARNHLSANATNRELMSVDSSFHCRRLCIHDEGASRRRRMAEFCVEVVRQLQRDCSIDISRLDLQPI
jgi:hypothetical protein